MEGQGAYEMVLRRGSPVLSAEAKSALLSGKKLRRALVTLTQGEDTWQTALDADEFVFRGLKLPETESFDFLGRFQERMILLDSYVGVFLRLYEVFLEQRIDAKGWGATVKDIHKWVADRSTRR
jgi:hypothetical protein